MDASDDETSKSIDSDKTTSEKEVLELVKSFYAALTTGDQDALESIYSQSNSKEVSEVRTIGKFIRKVCIVRCRLAYSWILIFLQQVIDMGGRIDSWKDCLAEGARPSEMQVSGADATVYSDTEAYTTCIEFPANTGMDSASLLAVQRFVRANKNEPWKLDLHQTIPWNLETKAQGTLQCDCRGCVALTRGNERRTFGGIIG